MPAIPPARDDMELENKMTVNSLMNMLQQIRIYQNAPVEPFPLNHPCKRDTAFLKFDEGHFLGEGYKVIKKALDCYVERYKIHLENPTGEHEVQGVSAPPHQWNRWSQRPEVRRTLGRMRVVEEK